MEIFEVRMTNSLTTRHSKFAIPNSSLCIPAARFLGGYDDGNQLIGLGLKAPSRCGLTAAKLFEQFEPEQRFVSLFLNDAELRNEVGP